MEILDKVLGNSGPIGTCLLFLWILSLSVIIERTVFWLLVCMRRNQIRENKVMRFVKDGKFSEAYKLASKSGDVFIRVFKYFLPNIPPAKEMDNVMTIALDKEFGRSHSFLRILNACAALAPALGLLGTITGLIKAFGTMSETVDMSAIALGISEAMTTTFLGLVVAVVNLAASHLFGGVADRAISKIDSKMNDFKFVRISNC
jgi:biopolymer transport protein ExbB